MNIFVHTYISISIISLSYKSLNVKLLEQEEWAFFYKEKW